jgi:hypothetical protein
MADDSGYDFTSDLTPYVDAWAEEPTDAPPAADRAAARESTWEFHDEQWRVMESPARIKVVCSGRRWGKSVTLARWAAKGAREDACAGLQGITWLIYPTYTMAQSLWREIQRVAPHGWITKSFGSERVPGGFEFGPARIEFKSAQHPEHLVGVIEGLRRVGIDEAGIMKESVWEESIQPALIDHSAPVLLAGTPKGRNWFWKLYQKGLDPLNTDVKTFGGPSSQNPWLKSDEIEIMRQSMSLRMFQQEFLARFLTNDGSVFRYESGDGRGLRALINAGGGCSDEKTVAMGVDLARVHDFTVVIGLSKTRRITYYDRFQRISWPLQRQRIFTAYKKLGKPRTLVDSTGVGDPILQDLVRMGMVRASGFRFTAQTKGDLIDGLASGIEKGEIGLIDENQLLNELEAFEFSTTKAGNIHYSAPNGLYDDGVCALALAYKAVRRGSDTGITL